MKYIKPFNEFNKPFHTLYDHVKDMKKKEQDDEAETAHSLNHVEVMRNIGDIMNKLDSHQIRKQNLKAEKTERQGIK
ncbi:hypothetical protein [Taibaiella sp. KBW10]|uniref:hypothetical protein n=1 Tax=Taibaiella sp. KBW10 TaxID=2153357 RepID=UPI000F5977BC|nr:hypothetical protein [Taibaiella sp. KBW10]